MLFVSQRKKLPIPISSQFDIIYKTYCPKFTKNGYAKLSKFITLNKNCGKMYFDETFHLMRNGGFTQLTKSAPGKIPQKLPLLIPTSALSCI